MLNVRVTKSQAKAVIGVDLMFHLDKWVPAAGGTEIASKRNGEKGEWDVV